MFSEKIIAWYFIYKRDLPWRETTDPYKVWLSEIILQQTRVSQGLPYYLKFVEAFPTVADMAAANEEQVLRLWQGLGYYSRGRNLHFTANYVSNQLEGKFPSSFSELKKLKGVGDYTAAAIASFCYRESVPVVDGNVLRVISRYMAIDAPIDAPEVKKTIFEISSELIDTKKPDMYNQAVMELGATICTPKNPKCSECPVASTCKGLINGIQERLPYKAKKTKVRQRAINYLVFAFDRLLSLKKREQNDIWENLYDFYEMPEGEVYFEKYLENTYGVLNEQDYILNHQTEQKHILSHQKLQITFYYITLKSQNAIPELVFFSPNEVDYIPKPIVIENYIQRLE